MRTRTLTFIATLAALLIVPATFAQGLGIVSVASSGPCGETPPVVSTIGQPFGAFDGRIESGNAAAGVVTLVGWALDDGGVVAVDVLVDGQVAGRAELGGSRPDVSAAFPGFPDSALPGWTYRLDTTRYLNGLHSVNARIVDTDGKTMETTTQVFEFTNTTHNLKPFGVIDYPEQNAILSGVCGDPANPDRIYTAVLGWVLDAGLENNDHGVGYVELLLDGTIIANSRRDCVHSSQTGGFTNCYGLRRPDVQADYETLKDSPNAGFRFVLDVGALVDFGYAEGSHVLTIRSGDQDSQVANVDAINVSFLCNDGTINDPSIGAITTSVETLGAGITDLTGFALDRQGVDRVKVFIDGVLEGDATYGLPDEDATRRFPGYPDSLLPGWIFDVSSLGLSDGLHFVSVVAVDGEGNETIVGEADFRALIR